MKLKTFWSIIFFCLSIFAFLFTGKCLSAQNAFDTLSPASEYYKRGKINLGEKKVYVIKNIVIEKDSVLFTDIVTGMDHMQPSLTLKNFRLKPGQKLLGLQHWDWLWYLF